MARSKQNLAEPAGKSKGPNSDKATPTPLGKHPLARRRALVMAVLAVVATLAVGASAMWRRVAPLVAGRERYLLQADQITISDPPEWIVADVRGQVIQNAGLAGRLSILDADFLTAIEHAFALHPWIESVDRIEKKYPPAVHVEVTFRKPVAVVEVPHGERSTLVPVDSHGILLPADDVPLIRRDYLPRITGVVGQPPAGQRWDDPRVAGAVTLAALIAADWESLHLMEIVPSARPEIQGDRRYYVYDLVTRGGTRIVWGALPDDNVPGETAFAVKLTQLKHCVAQYAPLDWTDWPAVIDVRHGIQVTPRTAKKAPQGASQDPVVAENPQQAETAPVVK